ncbi:DUF6049 family protein [Actinospongicola halichondriae]|uniref:DUF6049 family protein n=1 Tax=Actinospongicola halichondriae TaxID=3236844 RepID=UPI003D497ADC
MTRHTARILLVVGIVASLAAPAGARQVDDEPVAGIELTARTPWVSETEPLALEIATTGDTAGTTMRIRIHPPLADTAELEQSLSGDVGGITRSVDLGPTDEITVSGDGTRTVTLTTEEIRAPGVHPVVVELRSPEGGVIDLIRTPVIRLGTEDEPLVAPRLSVVVDALLEPTIDPDGRRAVSATELDRLGRLTAFLDEVATLDPAPAVRLLVLPDTLDALALTTDPRAPELVDRLLAAATEDPGVMPYVAVSAAALETAGLGDVLETVIAAGSFALTDRVGDDADPTLWADDEVTPEAARRLADLGVETVLTSAAAVGEHDAGSEDDRLVVPAGPRPVPALTDSGLTAVVADGATAALLVGPALDRVDAGPIAVADLLLRDAGRGSDVVVHLDDIPEASTLQTLMPLLADDASPVPIVAVPVGEPTTVGDGAEPEAVTLPEASDDLRPIADRYRAVDREVATFDGFVDIAASLTADLGLQQLTSVARGLDDDERLALLAAAEAVVAQGFDGVTLTGQTDLNLTSRRGTLPVAIANTNDYPVRLMVRIRSDRLRFPDGEEFEIVAEPDVTRIDVPVEALATGSVPTFVEVRTPDGTLLLDDRQLNVRSTAVSGVGLALSLGALAVLAVWWVRTWRKSRVSDEDPQTA